MGYNHVLAVRQTGDQYRVDSGSRLMIAGLGSSPHMMLRWMVEL